ncbi:MAG: hypothetical protein R2685_14330 [Candidatus Nitrosocosmicus sp.]|nr:hypothetical protein [Candidatus Nitrosocosmicus sp.]
MYKYNNTKNAAVILAAAIATAIVMGPIINNIGEVLAKQKYDDWDDCRDDHSKNWCKKYFKHHHDNDDDDDGNRASQGIGQSQSSSQNSQVVSGGDSIGSGNNFSFQNQVNTGNNALAQDDDDDDDDDDGNRASQGIGQSQSSSQNSQVVSGGDSIGSGNNFSFQNQVNTGNNALAQQ